MLKSASGTGYRRLCTMLGASALGALLLTSAARADDCVLGQRYLALANDRLATHAVDEAIDFLSQSAKSCPKYEVYEQLGELAAQQPQPEDKAKAVDAFVAAHGLAPSPAARARSLYHYAALLNQEGDPQNANPLIIEARRLDGTNADIRALADRIAAQVAHPTVDQLRGGLRDSLFRPIRLAEAVPSERGSRAVARVMPMGPSINIPINFETGSVVVDEATRPNIALLAKALADPSNADRRFLFVGHADIRGSELRNVALSKERAESIYQDILLLEPSLKGRVEIVGRGSAEPLDRSNDERAYRTNRRLQVVLQ